MNFIEILDHILNYFFIGMGIGLVIFVLRLLIVLLCRKNGSNFIAYISNLFIRHEVNKVQELGFQAFIYSPIIDGKKTTVEDAIKSQHIKYKNPLILEQDHSINASVFNKYLYIMFYKRDDLSIKGFFLEINSNQTYTAKLKVANSDDTNNS